MSNTAEPPAKMENLTAFHIAILHHTVHRAAGGRYCGGGEHMNDLVDCGLMRPIPSPKWCPDSFFTITDQGREQLKLHQ